MTKRQGKSGTIDVKALLAEDEEFLRALVRTALQRAQFQTHPAQGSGASCNGTHPGGHAATVGIPIAEAPPDGWSTWGQG